MPRTDAAPKSAKFDSSAISAIPDRSGNVPNQTLSEYASKQLLADYGVCVTQEILADNPQAAVEAAAQIGFPVVVKLIEQGGAAEPLRGYSRSKE